MLKCLSESGGKVGKALIDSGSSQTFVQRACLGTEGLVGLGSVKVRCIHGDESEHQTADVQWRLKVSLTC